MKTDRFTIDEQFAEVFGIAASRGRAGLSLEQVIQTVHPDDKAGLVFAIETAIARGGPYAHQYRVRRLD
ncbi:PAS domain-containing protein, partial [Salmonella sp. S121-66422]|uniref:PAS domain-containing protein n=1 Tax=Salmonella sp. S121-66422 TaxID=2665610 RepID=UPI0039775067